MRLEIREAALLGLDAPKELKHSGAVDLNKRPDFSQLTPAELSALARRRDQSAACGDSRMTVAPQLDMELLTALVNNPDWIEQELAERSLAEFIRQMWTSIDPSPYVGNWHIDAIAEHLEAVNRGEISRLDNQHPAASHEEYRRQRGLAGVDVDATGDNAATRSDCAVSVCQLRAEPQHS